MGRNDNCFCGSGKKVKKCHPNMHEDSIAAKVLKSYRKIDNVIQEHQNNTVEKPPCKKGCSECCYQYFAVTEAEFYIILDEIKKWDEKAKQDISIKAKLYKDEFTKSYPKLAQFLDTRHTGKADPLIELGKSVFKTDFPCIFLDDSTNMCKIYDVRPQVCRTHGNCKMVFPNESVRVDNDYFICSKINKSDKREFLADLGYVPMGEHDYKYVLLAPDKPLAMKSYPLFYHLYHNLYVDNLNFEKDSKITKYLISLSEKQFISEMQGLCNVR